MLRKIISTAALAALLLSLCGCSSKANSSYTGTVSKISADSITLETESGKVTIKLTASTQFSMGGFGGFGQIPEGDWPADGQRPERGEKPEGDFTKPEGGAQFPEGKMPEGMTPPEDGSFDGFSAFGGLNYSSIPVGASVTITTGADKTAASIFLSMNFQNFDGQMPNFQK